MIRSLSKDGSLGSCVCRIPTDVHARLVAMTKRLGASQDDMTRVALSVGLGAAESTIQGIPFFRIIDMSLPERLVEHLAILSKNGFNLSSDAVQVVGSAESLAAAGIDLGGETSIVSNGVRCSAVDWIARGRLAIIEVALKLEPKAG